MKSSGFVDYVEDYCCANFRNQQSFLTSLKYSLKIAIFANHYIFYIVYAQKNGLRALASALI